jgi:hypothetical protein
MLFWLQLFRRITAVLRAPNESARFGVRALLPVLVVGFLVQLFDNGFVIRPVAERVFLVAGLVLGLAFVAKRTGRDESAARDVR